MDSQMKKVLGISIIVYFTSTWALASDQAEMLMSKHIEASGGAQALQNMQSITRQGNIVFYEHDNEIGRFCYRTDLVYPTKVREQLKSDVIFHERGTDGVLFWLWEGSQYAYTEDQDIKDHMLDTANRANREMLWVIQESENYRLMPSPPGWAPDNSLCIQGINSNQPNYCFDETTGLINVIGNLAEYRWVGAWTQVGTVKIPFQLKHYVNGELMYSIQLDVAELDHTILDDQFIKPDAMQLFCG